MLYEVITIHPGTAEGWHIATNQRPENSDRSHALSESLRLIPVAFLNGGIWIERWCGRITSYNVCYTKLLRYNKGLQGHSDADVLSHALCDAMLGAAGLGDIGRHFPDTDKQFKDISSLEILRDVAALVAKRVYVLGNADITVVAQEPKLSSYFAAMRQNLAAACNVAPDSINLKATTTEEMGFEGRGEGMRNNFV